MPAMTEKQRRAAGAALHMKRSGDTSKTQGPSKSMAKTMTVDELREFATKAKGKPK